MYMYRYMHMYMYIAVVMREIWGRQLYHALLQSCQVNHGPELATFLLNHMTCRVRPVHVLINTLFYM